MLEKTKEINQSVITDTDDSKESEREEQKEIKERSMWNKCKNIVLITLIIFISVVFIVFIAYKTYLTVKLFIEDNERRYNPWRVTFMKYEGWSIHFTLENIAKARDEKIVTGKYNWEMKRLRGKVEFRSKRFVQLKIDSDESRWDIEKVVPLAFDNVFDHLKTSINETNFHIQSSPFSIGIDDEVTGKEMYTTKDQIFRYYDKYIQWDAIIHTNTSRVFGLGPKGNTSFLIPNITYKSYATTRTINLPNDKHLLSHPFVMIETTPGKFIGVFIYSSNGYLFKFTLHNSSSLLLSHKMMGGIINMFFIAQGTAQRVLRTYIDIIGHPKLPPMWALGLGHNLLHLTSLNDYKALIEDYEKNEIPIDSLWADRNLMYLNRSFTIDKDKYKNIKEIVNYLNEKKKSLVVRADPYININETLFENALSLNVLIRKDTGVELNKETDAGDSVFIDVLNKNLSLFYSKAISILNSTLPKIDGIWLHDNDLTTTDTCEYKEPTFKNEEETSNYRYLFNNEIGDVIYNPYSLPLNCYGANKVSHYDFHNAYSILQAKAINKSLFVASLGSFPGIGRYSAVLEDDFHCPQNISLTEVIQSSITNSLLGISHTGTPLKLEECNNEVKRWFRVAGLLPLFFIISTEHQSFSSCSKEVIKIRYKLLQYMYTKLYFAHKGGDLAIQPLWLSYMEAANYTEGFMWEKELYVVNSISNKHPKIFIPNNSYWIVFGSKEIIKGKGEVQEIPVEYDESKPLILQNEGTIIPVQDVEGVRSVADLSNKPFDLLIYTMNGSAKGNLVLGQTKVSHYTFELHPYEGKGYILQVHKWEGQHNKALLRGISLTGISEPVSICVLYSNSSISNKMKYSLGYIYFDTVISIENLQLIILYNTTSALNVCEHVNTNQAFSSKALINESASWMYIPILSESILEEQILKPKNSLNYTQEVNTLKSKTDYIIPLINLKNSTTLNKNINLQEKLIKSKFTQHHP